jgi:regulator of replication initiation timing
MSDTLKRLDALDGLAEQLVSEVQQLRTAKRELTEENVALRRQNSEMEAGLEASGAERLAVQNRVEQLVERIDQLLSLAEG